MLINHDDAVIEGLIHIVPLDYSTLCPNPSHYMLLTHLVEESKQYASWAANLMEYKILDNSLIELKGAVNIERVIQAAERIGANEIILPDVFCDRGGTQRAVMDAWRWLEKNEYSKQYQLMAVCQGRSIAEFAKCFEWLNDLPFIDVIGIPKVCAKLGPAGRPGFEHLWKHSSKQIHLLGIWYSWEELLLYEDLDRIRSCDTCLAAFQTKYALDWRAVRPDGFTVNLHDKTIDPFELAEHIDTVNAYLIRALRGDFEACRT